MLLHHNARGERVPSHLWAVVVRVHHLVSRPGTLEWWRGQVLQWCGMPLGRTPGELATLPQEPTFAERCAVLAAVHDFGAEEGMEFIGPHDRPEEVTKAATRFAVLKVSVEEYTDADAKRLMGMVTGIRKMPFPPFTFSKDFRAAQWGDVQLAFTVKQAACIAVMRTHGGWLGGDFILANAGEAYPVKKTESVRVELEGLECCGRLRDVFKGSPAWGSLIESHAERKNLFRLVRPPRPKL
jgi:hypothetical protein